MRANVGRRHVIQGGLALASLGLISGCGVRMPWIQPATPRRRIGYLSTQRPDPDPYLDALRQGLRDLGWIEGQNLLIESRHADGQLDRLPELAGDLVRLQVEVIHASSALGAQAVQVASPTMPIVIATAPNPEALGLTTSLARPDKNVTGLTSISTGLNAKRIELLREIVPSLRRLGASRNPTFAGTPIYNETVGGVEDAARAFGLQVHWAPMPIPDQAELERAFSRFVDEGVDVFLFLPDPVTQGLRAQIAELGIRHRLPTMGDSLDAAKAGMLTGYGTNFEDQYRRSAAYVDKLLKGAKPGDLPIEQPVKFDFGINQKTAQAIGLTIPPQVLAQGPEIIQ